MNKSVRIFHTPYELAEKFAEELVKFVAEAEKGGSEISIALSGGSTPELLYTVIGDHFSKSVKWDNVHFFWGDERCVPPEDIESNFGMTQRSLLRKINIPSSNIHRIRGEADPLTEASRYSLEIARYTSNRYGVPVFDLVILGVGEDGHTASIFPSNTTLMESEKNCEVAYHPHSGQIRITVTGRIINNSEKITFLVTGRKKAEIVAKIINNSPSARTLPASLIVPPFGELIWFLDEEAASSL